MVVIPLIAEHDTWISVDPIIGCPSGCRYCYLGPLGLRPSHAAVRATPAQTIVHLEKYFQGRMGDGDGPSPYRADTPICLGNYTDMFMTREGLDFLREYVPLHRKSFGQHPLCVVTKARLSGPILRALDDVGQTILVFLSQSFLEVAGLRTVIEPGPTSGPADTVGNLHLLADLSNITGLHFWRPIARRVVPDVEAARAQLRLIRDAGALARVAVGFKNGPGVSLSDPKLVPLLEESADERENTGEFLASDIREFILDAARQLGYPLYFNTSCAIALATGRPEALGTWREPMRSLRCEPCVCPRGQRHRCDLVRERDEPPCRTVLSDVRVRLGLPEGSVHWDPASTAIHVHSVIAQTEHNQLLHVIPHRLVPRGIRREEAWLGAFVTEVNTIVDLDTHIETNAIPGQPVTAKQRAWSNAMEDALGRLRQITGFVTTLHPEDDQRPLAFARYAHVHRVAELANWLCTERMRHGADLNPERVALLAWSHDLNRWPFAHNSERGLFDQAADVARYFADWQVPAGDTDGGCTLIQDLTTILSRRWQSGSNEARLVLLADIVAGFVEDPLLAVTGLDLNWRAIPKPIWRRLGLPMDQRRFIAGLQKLNHMLYERDVDEYRIQFDRLFNECVARFAMMHGLDRRDPLEEQWFNDLRVEIKEGFLRTLLFPYNNERIAHGSILKKELIVPLVRRWGTDAVPTLTSIDEVELLEWAVKLDVIEAGTEGRYYPDLDYFEANEPHLSFRAEVARRKRIRWRRMVLPSIRRSERERSDTSIQLSP